MGKFGYRIADSDSMLKFIQRGELLTDFKNRDILFDRMLYCNAVILDAIKPNMISKQLYGDIGLFGTVYKNTEISMEVLRDNILILKDALTKEAPNLKTPIENGVIRDGATGQTPEKFKTYRDMYTYLVNEQIRVFNMIKADARATGTLTISNGVEDKIFWCGTSYILNVDPPYRGGTWVRLADIYGLDERMKSLGYNTVLRFDTGDHASCSFLGKMGASIPESVKNLIKFLYKLNGDYLHKVVILESEEDDDFEIYDEDFPGYLPEDMDDEELDNIENGEYIQYIKGYLMGDDSYVSIGDDAKEEAIMGFVSRCIDVYLCSMEDSLAAVDTFSKGGLEFKSIGDSEEISVITGLGDALGADFLGKYGIEHSMSKDKFFAGNYFIPTAVEEFSDAAPLPVASLLLMCTLRPIVYNVDVLDDFYTGVARVFEETWQAEYSMPVSENEYSFVCGLWDEVVGRDINDTHLDVRSVIEHVLEWVDSYGVFSEEELKALKDFCFENEEAFKRNLKELLYRL